MALPSCGMKIMYFFYKVSTNDLSIPEVTTFIRIENNLRVKLFHEGYVFHFQSGLDTDETRNLLRRVFWKISHPM